MLMRRYEKLKHGAQRAAFVRFLLDNIRLTHEAYIPAGERLGVTIETMYILGVVVMGDIEGKPFTATK